jgi:hypothetical protein
MEIPSLLIQRTGSAFTIAICIIAFAHGEPTSTNTAFTTVPFEPRQLGANYHVAMAVLNAVLQISLG